MLAYTVKRVLLFIPILLGVATRDTEQDVIAETDAPDALPRYAHLGAADALDESLHRRPVALTDQRR